MCIPDNIWGDHLLVLIFVVSTGAAIHYGAQVYDHVVCWWQRRHPKKNRRWAKAR